MSPIFSDTRHLDGLKVYTISLQKREAGCFVCWGRGAGLADFSPAVRYLWRG
jgi:hypothetical protein